MTERVILCGVQDQMQLLRIIRALLCTLKRRKITSWRENSTTSVASTLGWDFYVSEFMKEVICWSWTVSVQSAGGIVWKSWPWIFTKFWES